MGQNYSCLSVVRPVLSVQPSSKVTVLHCNRPNVEPAHVIDTFWVTKIQKTATDLTCCTEETNERGRRARRT